MMEHQEIKIRYIEVTIRPMGGEVEEEKGGYQETEEKVTKPQPKKSEPKPKKSRSRFNDEQEAEIIRRYKSGEGPKAISESLGCARSTIIHIISKHGATEGRTGAHLRKQSDPQPEPQPEQPEPV